MQKHKYSNKSVFLFMTSLCISSALILSLVALSLKKTQIQARELDQIKQLLIAAKILSYDGSFLLKEDNSFVPAIYDQEKKMLVKRNGLASKKETFLIYNQRVTPMLVDKNGNTFTFTEANIDYEKYLKDNLYQGYSELKLKLIYFIKANDPNETLPYAYVIPINGYGLWGPIYGYLAIASDAYTVLGTTWYDQKETAGLGAVIDTEKWQRQFYDKKIFLTPASGDPVFEKAPVGLTVLKGNVKDVYPSSPKAKSAVDGIAGATLTGNGVTAAYFNCLQQYRPFLIKAHARYLKEKELKNK